MAILCVYAALHIEQHVSQTPILNCRQRHEAMLGFALISVYL